DVGASVREAPQHPQAPQTLLQPLRVRLERLLVELFVPQNLSGLAFPKYQPVLLKCPGKEVLVLYPVRDVGEDDRLEQRIRRRVAEFVGPSLGNQADITPVVSVDIRHVLPMAGEGGAAELREERIWIGTPV